MKKVAGFLNKQAIKKKRRSHPTDWVIMNAKAWISGKKTIDDIAKKISYDSILLVCLMYRGFDMETRKPKEAPVFVLGSGSKNKYSYGRVGEHKTYKIDTGSGHRMPSEPSIKIQNIVVLNKAGEIVSSENAIGLKEKRPLWVFK